MDATLVGVPRQLMLPFEDSSVVPAPGRGTDSPQGRTTRRVRDFARENSTYRGKRGTVARRPSEDWRIDEKTRLAGRRGLAAARAALSGLGPGDGPDQGVDAA